MKKNSSPEIFTFNISNSPAELPQIQTVPVIKHSYHKKSLSINTEMLSQIKAKVSPSTTKPTSSKKVLVGLMKSPKLTTETSEAANKKSLFDPFDQKNANKIFLEVYRETARPQTNLSVVYTKDNGSSPSGTMASPFELLQGKTQRKPLERGLLKVYSPKSIITFERSSRIGFNSTRNILNKERILPKMQTSSENSSFPLLTSPQNSRVKQFSFETRKSSMQDSLLTKSSPKYKQQKPNVELIRHAYQTQTRTKFKV